MPSLSRADQGKLYLALGGKVAGNMQKKKLFGEKTGWDSSKAQN